MLIIKRKLSILCVNFAQNENNCGNASVYAGEVRADDSNILMPAHTTILSLTLP